MRGRTLWRVALVVILFIGLFYLVTGTQSLGSNIHQLSRIYQVIHYLKTESLYPIDTNSLVEGALRGIVKSTQDPYSAYLTPEEYNELNVRIRGSFGGLGIVIGKREGSLLIVAPPYPGTPAEKAGLKQGDIISYIDDRDTREMDADTAATLMRGQPGSRVVLKIKRNGYPDLIEVPIIRETINIPTLQCQILDQDPRIGYISISSFSLNTGTDLHKELAKVTGPGVKGLILDLRNNPGGELGAAIEVAGYFVPKGPVVRIVDRSGKEEVHGVDGKHTINLPLVVLVNEMSASASEIVAGAIKDRKAGVLVGSKTYGKGLVQVIYPLKDGAGLKITTSKYLTPEGNDIDQKGITPDIAVEQPPNSQQDLQLAKAVSVLQSQYKP